MASDHGTRPPLVVIPQYFGSLVFDRRSSRYMPFDQEASRWLCESITRPFFARLDRIPAADRERAIDFYEYFYELGFFAADGRLAAVKLDADPPDDHLTGPLAVHLEIVGACNLTCTHCFAGELPRHHDPLSLAEMDRLFDEFAEMGAFRLGLTGGEPLLRKDLFDIIDHATDRGLHPCLTTNGLLIDEEIARQFGRRDLLWLNVSLDGATAATNDSVRGDGTFERVLSKLRILDRHARFTIAFTITRNSADEVQQCADLARDLGAHTAVFRPLYPVGVAKQNMDLMPTFAQYSDALSQLSRCTTGGDVHAIDPFSPQSRAEVQAKSHPTHGCGAGNLIASISVQGEVNPCSFLGSQFNAANVRQQSFRDIWHNSQGFTAMRDRGRDGDASDGTCVSGGTCASGESGGSFRGGCRARSLALRGSVDRADPWHDDYLVQIGEPKLDPRQPDPPQTDVSAADPMKTVPSHPLTNLECHSADHRER